MRDELKAKPKDSSFGCFSFLTPSFAQKFKLAAHEHAHDTNNIK